MQVLSISLFYEVAEGSGSRIEKTESDIVAGVRYAGHDFLRDLVCKWAESGRVQIACPHGRGYRGKAFYSLLHHWLRDIRSPCRRP